MTDQEMKAEAFDYIQDIVENIARVKDPELIWIMLDKMILNVCDPKKTRGSNLETNHKALKEQVELSYAQLASDRADRKDRLGYYSAEAKERRERYEGKKVVIARWPAPGKDPYDKEWK